MSRTQLAVMRSVALAALVATSLVGCGAADHTEAPIAATASTSTSTVAPSGSGNRLLDSYLQAMDDQHIPIRDRSLKYGSFSTDLRICQTLRDGSVDAFDLAGREGVALSAQPRATSASKFDSDLRDNGRRIVAMVPILCPDAQRVVDEALSGSPKMINLRPGKALVRSVYDPTGPVVQPGTYRTTQPTVSDCYWERSDEQGNIIDNGLASIAESITVTIQPTDGGFTSRNCGPWKRID